eukprot:GEMP01062117.1.p1 GENE.GEMP01062117.1~~GEMP01062117.1.p1  ORF type:complete len:280 (+),score=65.45 GEMP01062117.1:90-842(+)
MSYAARKGGKNDYESYDKRDGKGWFSGGKDGKGGKDGGKSGGKGKGKSDSKGKGKASRPWEPEHGPYLGIVSRVNEAGYAFIESPVCKSWYGQDVYVFPRVMEENGLGEGDAVGFYVHENDKGQPAVNAFKPIWKLMLPPKDGVVPPLGRYVGGILNLTPRGHAYIYCPEIKHQYSKDVYVNEKVVEANGATEGQYVCFDLHINKSGMPQASSPLWLETNKKDWAPPQRRPREPAEDADGEEEYKRPKTE